MLILLITFYIIHKGEILSQSYSNMSFLSALFKTKTPSHNTAIHVLNAFDFKKQLSNSNIHLIDVRTTNEYRSGHIQGALLINFFNTTAFKTHFSKLHKDTPVLLYCRSGNRSHKAAKQLVKLGFTTIYDLKGGFNAWKKQYTF